jgi:prophage antirepressor-like protein
MIKTAQNIAHKKFGTLKIAINENDKLMLKAYDVIRALGFTNPAKARKLLTETTTMLIPSQKGPRKALFISLMQSITLAEQAETEVRDEFIDWVCDEAVAIALAYHG